VLHSKLSHIATFVVRTAFSMVLVLVLGHLATAQPPVVELTIPNETVPAGGMLQLKVQITEPKPISKGGQRSKFQSPLLGSPQGIALFSVGGDASGTAVLSKGAAQFSLNSPLFTMGDVIDYPILTIAIPVKPTAQIGRTAPLVLDPSLATWIDPTGQNYPVVLTDGLLTVGGTLSISNIVPGGGVVPAGTKIAIMGMGFPSDAVVQVNEAIIATQTYVSPNEIDVTLTTDTNMTSKRIRVTNKSTNEKATYYSYQRTTAMGKSKHALVASTVPLFAQSTWTLAYFRPVLNASQFSGLALENPTAKPVKISMQLFAANGTLLKRHNIKLLPNKRFTRDLAELFVGVVPASGTSLKVTADAPISMLGLLGDDVLGTMDPVDPSSNP
jgi:IPT/TIG domain-containing protein